MAPTQKPVQRNNAEKPTASFIFLHGLGDDADGWTSKLFLRKIVLIQAESTGVLELTESRYCGAVPWGRETPLSELGMPLHMTEYSSSSHADISQCASFSRSRNNSLV